MLLQEQVTKFFPQQRMAGTPSIVDEATFKAQFHTFTGTLIFN